MRLKALLLAGAAVLYPTQAVAPAVTVTSAKAVSPAGTTSARLIKPAQTGALSPDTVIVIPDGGKRLRITYSPGGVIQVFNEDAQVFAANKVKVVVDGICASSCTRFLVPSYGVDICATPQAVFMFHKPYMTQTVARKAHGKTTYVETILKDARGQKWSDDNWKVWLTDMSPAFQSYLADKPIPSMSRGQEDMFEVPAEKAWELGVRRCTPDGKIVAEGGAAFSRL